MPWILIFGPGYTAGRIADRLAIDDWQVIRVRRDAGEDEVRTAIASVDHILSSVPPDKVGRDPILDRYGAALAASTARWIGYLSSTGVYGDTGGAWVDESTPIGTGRRGARAAADAAWSALHPEARVFRLPGIYGPGRSPLDRVAGASAHRVDLPAQVFSRIHVDDIGDALIASFDGPPSVYNIADDRPVSQNVVIEEACRLLGLQPPPLLSLDDAGLSPQARAFYAENRRVANGKAKRLLGWRPRYPDYRAGLAALARSATISPISASATPKPADSDQR
jgi:nucleoside-diphosphate-sugar epimerase